MATEPHAYAGIGYDIEDPKELKRLLRELSGYLGPTMECRNAFLTDGTDLPGRRAALDALDEIRAKTVKEMRAIEAIEAKAKHRGKMSPDACPIGAICKDLCGEKCDCERDGWCPYGMGDK